MTLSSVTTREQALNSVQNLSAADLRWLIDQLTDLVDDAPLPDHATLDEAIDLFLADECSLGRAAELADVTRWELKDVLKARGIPIYGGSDKSIEEMNASFERLEAQGIL